MSQVEALLSAAGIDPRQERAAAAALMVRRLPMRRSGVAERSPQKTIERGWCAGPAELAGILTTITGVETQQGEAFGGSWPWLEFNRFVVAPGLPVRLCQGAEETGPDGVYDRSGGGIFREAGGCRKPFLSTQASTTNRAPDFDLLWFSDDGRFIARKATLEVEDLFSKTTSWVDRERLERLLVRKRRLEANVFDGLAFEKTEELTTVEVSRMFDFDKIPGLDPGAYLRNRIDFSSIESQGDSVVFEDLGGQTVEFQTTGLDSGWLLDRVEGRFPFESVRFERKQGVATLGVTLAAEIDIFSPGIRGRVVFDLNADLLTFVRQHQKV